MLDKGKMTHFFRSIGMMHQVDWLKYQYLRFKNLGANRAYKKSHPGVIFPPDYMMFEAFNLDYQRYYEGGKTSAQWMVNEMAKHGSLLQKDILDWGCGPARIIRHLPDLIKTDCRFFGTDYNEKTIHWCQKNINGVEFSQNGLHPPTRYVDNSFDFIYGISIFTHLSEVNHKAWYDELIRICKPGGVILVTTQGDAFVEKLAPEEKRQYEAGQLVIRGQVVEGHRVFSAFHPPVYIKNLFGEKAEILEHTEGKKKNWGIEQDLWGIRKR